MQNSDKLILKHCDIAFKNYSYKNLEISKSRVTTRCICKKYSKILVFPKITIISYNPHLILYYLAASFFPIEFFNLKGFFFFSRISVQNLKNNHLTFNHISLSTNTLYFLLHRISLILIVWLV